MKWLENLSPAQELARSAKVGLPAARRALRRYRDRYLRRRLIFAACIVGFWGCLMLLIWLFSGTYRQLYLTLLNLPLFFTTIIFALWPQRLPKRLARIEEKRPSALCANCGYDLRGTPGDRCPECGEQRDADELAARKQLDGPRTRPDAP